MYNLEEVPVLHTREYRLNLTPAEDHMLPLVPSHYLAYTEARLQNFATSSGSNIRDNTEEESIVIMGTIARKFIQYNSSAELST